MELRPDWYVVCLWQGLSYVSLASLSLSAGIASVHHQVQLVLTEGTMSFFKVLYVDSKDILNVWTFSFFGGERVSWCLLGRHSTSWATLPALFFVVSIFKVGSHELFAQASFWTAILLISVSQLARITGVSQQHPPSLFFFTSLCDLWYCLLITEHG
jgi:hypothetical protein